MARPQRPPASPLLKALAAGLDHPAGPRRGEHLLVAVSGGPDSTALLAGLADLAPPRGLALTAAHVEHGLRGDESRRDADGAAALAARLGLLFERRAGQVPPGANLEARARRVRYRVLGEVAAAVGAGRIVTGHTLDDQAETILLRLLRGAGRRGLGGMRVVRGRLLRPLLAATRADVRRFLADRDLPFRVDRSNADLAHARNRVRRLLLPFLTAEFNPRIASALAALAARLADEDEFLAAEAEARACGLTDGPTLAAAVAAEPAALARRIVRAWLAGQGNRQPSAAHVERVLALAAGEIHGEVAVPGPGRVLVEGTRVVYRTGRARRSLAYALPIGPGTSVGDPEGRWRLSLSPPRVRTAASQRPVDATQAVFDADVLPPHLVVRGPRPGDRVRVLGGRTRKLQDVLVDAKVPREIRATVPVLVGACGILWVAGVVRGAGAPITDDTRRVVTALLEATGGQP